MSNSAMTPTKADEDAERAALTAQRLSVKHNLAWLTAFRAEARREILAALKQCREQEQYWRHDVVTTRLCPVDHKQPHVSHDCIAKIEERWRSEREACERIVEDMHRPDAELIRALPGDQTEENRYWVGWTDALDDALRRLRGRAK